MQFTQYFLAMHQRPDRANIRLDWNRQVIDHPVKEVVQQDGSIRRWAPIPGADGKYLRIILLADRQTVDNAFFDRSYTP
jgi:hypothetical protein